MGAGRIFTGTWHALVDAGRGFIEHNALRRGAALSYYSVFSLAPLLIIVVAIASLLLDDAQVREHLLGSIGSMAGADAAQAVGGMMDSTDWRRNGPLATLIAIATTVFGASVVMAELKTSLDEIVGPPAAPTQQPAWYTLLAVRIRALSMVLVIALLLLASMVVSAVLTAFGKWWSSGLPIWAWLLATINLVVSLGLAGALYWFTYRYFPARRMDVRACAVGAVVAAVLFAVGKSLIGLYIGAAGVGSAFGAAGSLAVIMIWVYWTSQIVLFGAELSRAIDAWLVPRAPSVEAAAGAGSGGLSSEGRG